MQPTAPHRDRPAASATRLACRACLIATTLGLAACQSAILDPRGPIGRAEKQILLDSLAIMLAIVVPTIIATVCFAWWFRASNKKAIYLPEWEFSGRIELFVWAIPLMTIILLGGVTWIAAHELDPALPIPRVVDGSQVEPIDIQVVSLDWKWLFIYPKQGVASVNQLTVPAGVPLHFSMTSASVMNTFFIPQFGSMIYTMNGMATEMNLMADAPGIYRGISGHYSGEGFSDMHFEVHALPTEQFAAWVETTRGSGQALDTKSYLALAVQSIDIPVSTYRAVDRDLFKKILSQEIAPGPGPVTKAEGAVQSPKQEP